MSQTSMVPVALLATLETAINGALALDPATLERLTALQGRVIALDIKGTGVRLIFAPSGEGLRLMGRFDGEPDTIIRAAPLSLLRLQLSQGQEGLFTGEVEIEGDVELGQRFQRIIGRIDLDWEEHLSRLTGDVLAHQVGNGVRGLMEWTRNAAHTLGLDVAEYLQHERTLLPARADVEEFLTAVDQVRTDVDRLEARVRRLDERARGE